MLDAVARPAFLAACATNVALAVTGAVAIEAQSPVVNVAALIGGAVACIVAAALAINLLMDTRDVHRGWIKAALVFLVLGPLAFWGLQWPAAAGTLCIDNCISPAQHMRLLGDIEQSQWAMIAVSLAALFCAARIMTTFLDELAD
jgi:hypothetical protein